MRVAVVARHRLVVVSLHLALAEAGEGAARGQAVVRHHEVVILNRVLLQLRSVRLLDGLAVDLGELACDLSRHPGDLVNDGKRGKEKNADDREGDELAEEVVRACVDAILPNDVRRLGRLLELHGQAEHLPLRFLVQCNDCRIFLLKRDESGRWARQ